MKRAREKPPVVGIAGWKKSGKTTLVTRLIAEFTARGLKVATIKHAHHDFQIDDKETDSARHREAGAQQVAVVSAKRWALVSELGETPEPPLDAVISWIGPCDLIIVEGYKTAPIPKIELRRQQALSQRPLADTDPHFVAIAADHRIANSTLPQFSLDDVTALADFIASTLGLPMRSVLPATSVE